MVITQFFMFIYIYYPKTCSLSVPGRQSVLVHHESGVASISTTAVGYQSSHLDAAEVLPGVRHAFTVNALSPPCARALSQPANGATAQS